jgi:hypothetical protein
VGYRAALATTVMIVLLAGPASPAGASALAASPGIAAHTQPSVPIVEQTAPCVRRGITMFCAQQNSIITTIAMTTVTYAFGDPGDLAVFGDWDGNGTVTPAVFRPATFTWYLTNTENASDPPVRLSYGEPGDIPLAGDWQGSGIQTIGVYRPSDSTFYLRNTNTSGVADETIPLGDPGDIGLAGDFDHNGITRVGVYRPQTATFYESHASGPVTPVSFGNLGDRPMAGNFECGGTDGIVATPIAVFRPSTITWYGLCASDGNAARPIVFSYGDPTDVPFVGS